MQFQMQRRIRFKFSIRFMFQDAINHVPTDFQLSVFKFKLLTATPSGSLRETPLGIETPQRIETPQG